jgi:hypothetical protein
MDTSIAYLTIIPRGRMTSYRLCDGAGRLLWATRAYSTADGQQGARERLRAWMKATGSRVELTQTERRRRA